jgi:hypothetical protein
MAPEGTPAYLVPLERIEASIHEIRGLRVVLAHDLAGLYGVSTKALNQAVKRNRDRFPDDFMFQLTWNEVESLRTQSTVSSDGVASRSQFVTLKKGRNIKYLPYAFTEHGAVMAASVLNARRAVEVSVFVVRAFTRMRRMLADQRQLALRLAEIESKLAAHDQSIKVVFDAIRQLMKKPEPYPSPRKIGLHVSDAVVPLLPFSIHHSLLPTLCSVT